MALCDDKLVHACGGEGEDRADKIERKVGLGVGVNGLGRAKREQNGAAELERVNFELNFVKDIVQRVIESHPSDLELINGDTLMSYNKRGAELQRKYAALANEMEKEYIPECLEGHQYSWIIPNNSDEMTITIKCNCEIPELEGIA